MITKDELKHTLTDTESYYIELTTSTDNADKFCQAICTFSNDLPGNGKNGYLIIGAHDSGKLSGLKVEDKLLLQISNIRTDGNILPHKSRAGRFSKSFRHNGYNPEKNRNRLLLTKL